MRIINPEVFEDAKARFPEKAMAIDRLRVTIGAIHPRNSAELKAVLPSMERFVGLKNGYRFDVGGRKGLRMIAVVVIQAGTMRIRMLGSHDEYDRYKP